MMNFFLAQLENKLNLYSCSTVTDQLFQFPKHKAQRRHQSAWGYKLHLQNFSDTRLNNNSP